MSGQWPRSISLAAASDYFLILVDFRKAKIKRGFRRLRTAASLRGWIAPGLRPGPILACGRDLIGA